MFTSMKTIIGSSGAVLGPSFIYGSYECISSDSLQMDSTDFNTTGLSTTKYAVSVWVKQYSGSGFSVLLDVDHDTGVAAYSPMEIVIGGTGYVTLYTYTSDGGDGHQYDTQSQPNGTPFATKDTWIHLYYVVDPTESTDTNRMRLYINGQQLSLRKASTLPYPTLNATIDWSTTSGTGFEVSVGGLGTATTQAIDGVFTQFAFFNGTVPDIADVYDDGPVDVSALPGLYSLLSGIESGGVFPDDVLATDWTANGTPELVADEPT